MRKLETGEIAFSEKEAEAIRWFIDNALDREWDRYTDHVIVEKTTWEEGKRRMNPEMYDLAEKIQQTQYE